LLADQLGGNAWDDPGHIWYTTLQRLSVKSQFQDCANISYQVAGELFGGGSKQQKAVKTAWSEVGLTVQEARGVPARPPSTRAASANGEMAELKKLVQKLARDLEKVKAALG